MELIRTRYSRSARRWHRWRPLWPMRLKVDQRLDWFFLKPLERRFSWTQRRWLWRRPGDDREPW